MALSRVTTWTAGQTLTAAALNAEFDNILVNPISLFSPSTGNINMAFNQITNLELEKLGADPAAGHAGRVFYNTASAQIKYDDGATINAVAGSAAAAYPAAGSYVRGLHGVISTNLGVFTADKYLLQPTNGVASFLLQSTDAISINTRTAGPIVNGRDQVAAFASTDVHWYAISTGALSTAIAGLVSSQPPTVGPTMPSSYSAWAYLGASKYSTGSSGVVLTHHQRGAESVYMSPPIALNAGTATALTSVSISSAVPGTALRSAISYAPAVTGAVGSTEDAVATLLLAVTSSAGGALLINIGVQGYTRLPAPATAITFGGIGTFSAQQIVAGTLYYNQTPNVTGSTGLLFLSILGYSNPNGDV